MRGLDRFGVFISFEGGWLLLLFERCCFCLVVMEPFC